MTRNIAVAQIVSSEDQTEVAEQQTAEKEIAKNKKKAAKAPKAKMVKVLMDKMIRWRSNQHSFEKLFLKVTLEYKVSKAVSCIYWKSVLRVNMWIFGS